MDEHKHFENGTMSERPARIIPPPKTKSSGLPGPKTKSSGLPGPNIIQKLQTPLKHPIDPLCQNDKYRNNRDNFRNPWCLQGSWEKRVSLKPEDITKRYEEYKNGEWNNKSRCNKIFTILYSLPIHIYRRYFSSIDYKQYYNSLYYFVSNYKPKKN